MLISRQERNIVEQNNEQEIERTESSTWLGFGSKMMGNLKNVVRSIVKSYIQLGFSRLLVSIE